MQPSAIAALSDSLAGLGAIVTDAGAELVVSADPTPTCHVEARVDAPATDDPAGAMRELADSLESVAKGYDPVADFDSLWYERSRDLSSSVTPVDVYADCAARRDALASWAGVARSLVDRLDVKPVPTDAEGRTLELASRIRSRNVGGWDDLAPDERERVRALVGRYWLAREGARVEGMDPEFGMGDGTMPRPIHRVATDLADQVIRAVRSTPEWDGIVIERDGGRFDMGGHENPVDDHFSLIFIDLEPLFERWREMNPSDDPWPEDLETPRLPAAVVPPGSVDQDLYDNLAEASHVCEWEGWADFSARYRECDRDYIVERFDGWFDVLMDDFREMEGDLIWTMLRGIEWTVRERCDVDTEDMYDSYYENYGPMSDADQMAILDRVDGDGLWDELDVLMDEVVNGDDLPLDRCMPIEEGGPGDGEDPWYGRYHLGGGIGAILDSDSPFAPDILWLLERGVATPVARDAMFRAARRIESGRG